MSALSWVVNACTTPSFPKKDERATWGQLSSPRGFLGSVALQIPPFFCAEHHRGYVSVHLFPILDCVFSFLCFWYQVERLPNCFMEINDGRMSTEMVCFVF